MLEPATLQRVGLAFGPDTLAEATTVAFPLSSTVTPIAETELLPRIRRYREAAVEELLAQDSSKVAWLLGEGAIPATVQETPAG